MENKNLKDSFCQTCDLQSDNKTIFDLHLSVVHNLENLENKHGNKMVTKTQNTHRNKHTFIKGKTGVPPWNGQRQMSLGV